MRITVLATGSRGDAQPYIALAVGLRRAGCDVRVATHEQFLPLLTGHDLEHALVRGNPRDLLDDTRAHTMLDAQTDPIHFLYHFALLLKPVARQIIGDCIRACDGSDAVVLSNMALVPGFLQVPRELGLPYCLGLLQPFLPTGDFASPFLPELAPWIGFGRAAYNRWSHRAFSRLFRTVFAPGRHIIRDVMGLQRLPRDGGLRAFAHEQALFAFSPSVIPRPADWPPTAHVTGYWYLDAPPAWEPAPALTAFLEAGPPPVYVGFGSMTGRDPRATTALVLEALERTGQRGILLTGSGAMLAEGLPESVLAIDSAPHGWLFPRTAAVVHHGGAGTTAAGLRAGVPSIVVPHFADQPFWARTVYGLGVGPRPIPRRRLTAARLADAIAAAVDDEGMRERAAALGERIRAEDGVARAVSIIAEHLDRAPTRE